MELETGSRKLFVGLMIGIIIVAIPFVWMLWPEGEEALFPVGSGPEASPVKGNITHVDVGIEEPDYRFANISELFINADENILGKIVQIDYLVVTRAEAAIISEDIDNAFAASPLVDADNVSASQEAIQSLDIHVGDSYLVMGLVYVYQRKAVGSGFGFFMRDATITKLNSGGAPLYEFDNLKAFFYKISSAYRGKVVRVNDIRTTAADEPGDWGVMNQGMDDEHFVVLFWPDRNEASTYHEIRVYAALDMTILETIQGMFGSVGGRVSIMGRVKRIEQKAGFTGTIVTLERP